MVVFVGICIVGKNLNPVSYFQRYHVMRAKRLKQFAPPGSYRRTLNNPITVYSYIPTSGTLC